MKKIRVLFVNGGLMDYGGISSFLINYFRQLKTISDFHFDFCVIGLEKGPLDDEVLDSGSKIYRIHPRSQNIKKYHEDLKSVFVKGDYDIIHSNADSGNCSILKIAKKSGIPIRISHSHNTDLTKKTFLRVLLSFFEKRQVSKYATHLLACSEQAGLWLYGKKVKFQVIKNAIDTSRFSYSLNFRHEIREKYGIEKNEILLGNIGRLDYQKNQRFLLEVLEKLNGGSRIFKLMIVGEGHLKEEITNLANEKGVNNNLIVVDFCDDVFKYYSAFDIFCFPSIFEGLGMVAIEAQCSGLPCLISERISENNVCMLKNSKYLKLDSNEWAKEILVEYGQRIDSMEAIKIIKKNGYDAKTESLKLLNLYKELVK